jgi:hypothetical protein
MLRVKWWELWMGTARNSQKSENGGNGVGWWQGGDVNHLWVRWGLKMEEVGPQG